jgi:GNAT superfamily N-acetyltransferase
MRLPPLLGPLIGLADSFALPGEGMMPGFVWLEGGRVVGTASVRRARAASDGWLISNVAVHPDYQGRGIGRALLEAALDFAQDCAGTWVVLQVRDRNVVARRLYESLGFRPIAEVLRLRRAAQGAPDEAPVVAGLRPARRSDGRALFRLARSSSSHDVLWPETLNREIYGTGLWSRLTAGASGRRRRWWVWETPAAAGTDDTGTATGRDVRAAVGVETDARTPWDRLRLLGAAPANDPALAAQLIAFGLAQLASSPPRPVEIEHPRTDAATQAVLEQAGFASVYALVHMRMNLK